jgi:hypothetical protein
VLTGRRAVPYRRRVQRAAAEAQHHFAMQPDRKTTLQDQVAPGPERVLNPEALGAFGGVAGAPCALVVLAAGKGTRFGRAPKCAQPVCGVPLGRHSIDHFRSLYAAPCIAIVGYAREEVTAALGADVIHVLTADPAGGTRLAAPDVVKAFIRRAFYERFGLAPRPEFVQPRPGGGAVGVRLDRLDQLPGLIARLEALPPAG